MLRQRPSRWTSAKAWGANGLVLARKDPGRVSLLLTRSTGLNNNPRLLRIFATSRYSGYTDSEPILAVIKGTRDEASKA